MNGGVFVKKFARPGRKVWGGEVAFLVLVGAVLFGHAAGPNADGPHDRLLRDVPPQRVLHYLLVNPERKEHWDWYRGKDTLRPHLPAFKRGPYELHIPPYRRGQHEIVIQDQVTLPRLTDEALKGFDQIWILELDYDSDVDVTDADVAAVKRFYERGGGVWVSFWGHDGKEDWTEDASRFSAALGIGYLRNYKKTGMYTKASSRHVLMRDVHELVTWSDPAVLKFTHPGVQVVWAPMPDHPIVACVDEREQGKGRLVVDGSVTVFYGCHPTWEHEKDKNLFHPDSERFAENALRWLANPNAAGRRAP